MNKSAIRKFAVWARQELIRSAAAQAARYGITAEGAEEASEGHVAGRVLSPEEIAQREELLARIERRGFDDIMEEAAYTWFNRFIALRFMEVNACLPLMVRLFSDENGEFHPQILAEALDLDPAAGFDVMKIARYMEREEREELYRYLLLTECHGLADIFPGLFEKEGDWSELLFPDQLLREGSVLARMVQDIPEEDWKDAVQILGWLYQYYNSEKKAEVFTALKKNKKIGKEDIPAATQLFTPDWIVRYMAENSLGRLWLSGHPEDRARFLPTADEQAAYLADGASEGAAFRESEEIKRKWYYHLDDAPQEAEVETALADIRRQAARLEPEDIRIIDPCCGSGHILAYAFDMLMDIYTAHSWRHRDAAASIVEHNLYGLDIDLRAAQLAYFSLMMKWMQYDRRVLARLRDEAERCKHEDIPSGEKLPRPHVRAVRESNHISDTFVSAFCGGDKVLRQDLQSLLGEMKDARTYGSLLTVGTHDWDRLYARMDAADSEVLGLKQQVETRLRPFVEAASMLSQTYDVVITNPPYMGSANMAADLSIFVKRNFSSGKADLFACFIERSLAMTKKARYTAMITQHAWMFLSSFSKLREKLEKYILVNTVHLGPRAFEEIGGEIVQTSAFVFQKEYVKSYKGTYSRLILATTQKDKENLFLSGEKNFVVAQENFWKIPGRSIAYWIKDFDVFDNPILGSVIDARIGMVSGNNDRFLRLWHEVSYRKIEFGAKENRDPQKLKWYPLQKGGDFRYWYGNLRYIINWENNGYELKCNNYQGKRIRSHNYNGEQQFKAGITWNSIASIKFCCRYSPQGFTFDAAGPLCEVTKPDLLFYVLGLLSSKIATYLFAIINPTMNFPSGYLESLPFIERKNERIEQLVRENISISKEDWDSFEISWDFVRHPMAGSFDTVEAGYRAWQRTCEGRFTRLRANEEELNRLFIGIYGLEGELTPDVVEKDVTVVRIFDSKEDIPEAMKGSAYALTKEDAVKSLLSYAVGCLFGRYSLDAPGLAYAGGDWDEAKYRTVTPAADGLIPVLDEDYRADDLMGRFLGWLDAAYGPAHREENLAFIAAALGGKGSPREVIRRYFFEDFFADHCRTYRKRPIYWLFDSGKKGGFRALMYLHRYHRDTAARLRTAYVHPLQQQYRAAMEEMARHITPDTPAAEKMRLTKRLARLREKDKELHRYEEKIHHLADERVALDLDDGVKVNYAKLQDVLAKIR